MPERYLLFGKNIKPCCAYCICGTPAADRVMISCPYEGRVAPNYHCKRYEYDPLRRKPVRVHRQEKNTPEEN